MENRSSNCFVNEISSLSENYLDIGQGSESYLFHQSIKGYEPSPVVSLKSLEEQLHVGSIFLKDESHRFGLDAFKALGASYAIHKIGQQKQINHYCTATDGNHGRAVAWYARQTGLSLSRTPLPLMASSPRDRLAGDRHPLAPPGLPSLQAAQEPIATDGLPRPRHRSQRA